MSKIANKSTLALAIAATFAFAAPAMAATVTNGAAPPNNAYSTVVATTDFTTTSAVTLQPIHINVVTTDQIIGRTTGFSVRLTLNNGATFGTAVTSTNLTVGGAATGTWTAAVAAGGGTTDNVVVITLSPSAANSSITSGDLLDLSGITVDGSSAPVTATIDFFDPVTTQTILNSINFTALSVADPLKYSFSPSVENPNAKIDVGSLNGGSKEGFSATGAVNGPRVQYFDAGDVEIGVNTGVLDAAGNNFSWDGTNDTVDLTVTGSFGAFGATGGSVFLTAGGECSAPGTVTAGTVNATGTAVTFPTLSVGAIQGSELCFVAPGDQVISATPVATSVVVTRAATTKTTSGSANGAPMQYNGPVDVVYTFNPASNTSMQSFLRISNTGDTGGLITITGVDDNGVPSAGSVSFNLDAGHSVQLTAQDLENGNAAKGLTGALGAGTGKWILTVTGEVPSMEVTNLNRSSSTDMVNNLGNPVSLDGPVTGPTWYNLPNIYQNSGYIP